MKKLIKLMADYGCYPLWEYDEEGLIGDLNPGLLPISQELVDEINHWGDTFEKILCIDNPCESSFHTNQEDEKFKTLGDRIAKKLREEFGKK